MTKLKIKIYSAISILLCLFGIVFTTQVFAAECLRETNTSVMSGGENDGRTYSSNVIENVAIENCSLDIYLTAVELAKLDYFNTSTPILGQCMPLYSFNGTYYFYFTDDDTPVTSCNHKVKVSPSEYARLKAMDTSQQNPEITTSLELQTKVLIAGLFLFSFYTGFRAGGNV